MSFICNKWKNQGTINLKKMPDLLFKFRVIFFLMGFAGIVSGMMMHVMHKRRYILLTLCLSSFFLFLFAALLSPFLNVWDERFHALVARNLMNHPLMPTLYDDPVIQMPYDRWDSFHIWLHKQPLFLWMMAFSFKLFGIHEIAVRIPSVILGCLLVMSGYRCGLLLGNHKIAFYTALLLLSSHYLIDLISGYFMLDQNDFTFLAFISLSLWSYTEYCFSGKRWWIILVGCFAGFAVLCKWLAGLLVYQVCMLHMFFSRSKYNRPKSAVFIAIFITALIALPWQLLIFYWYPAEAKASYEYNVNHLWIPLDGHGGPFLFHFILFPETFGFLASVFVLPGFYLFIKKSGMPSLSISFFVATIFVFLFFSVCATKMPSFTTIVILPVYLATAFMIDTLFSFLQSFIKSTALARVISVVLLIIIFFSGMRFGVLSSRHNLFSEDDQRSVNLTRNREIFRKLKLSPQTVIFNVPGRHYIECMFYTGLPAYNFIPDENQYRGLKNKNRMAALFRPEGVPLPAFIENDSTVILLNDKITRCE